MSFFKSKNDVLNTSNDKPGMKLFSVLDVKANYYLQVFCETSTVAALRGFETAVNDGKAIFSRFPDDFCLMELASFDQQTGMITPLLAPLNLGSARTVLRPSEVPNTLPFTSSVPVAQQ